MSENQLFLEILRHFIHAQPTACALSDPRQALAVLSLARTHSLYPVAYEALRTSEAIRSLSTERQAALKTEARRRIIGQAMRTSLFLGVYQRLLAAGVTPLVMKGLVLRDLYPQGDSRASSDEDLLVRREEFAALDESLTAQGFCRQLPRDPLAAHEITYWHKNGLHLEVHLTLFPEDSAAYGHLNRAFADVFDRHVTEEILSVPIHTLEPTQHMLYLLCHGVKHFLHSGFGIRQVCDMVVFAEHCGWRIDWLWLDKTARAQGIRVFWMNLFALGEEYLGFSWEAAGLPRPEDLTLDCEAMLEDILEGGVYGQSTAQRTHSANITLQAVSGRHEKTGLRRTVLPSLAYMETRYPYLKAHPWLLPVAWGQRVADYLRHADRAEAVQTIQTGQHRVALLRQYGLLGQESRGRRK